MSTPRSRRLALIGIILAYAVGVVGFITIANQQHASDDRVNKLLSSQTATIAAQAKDIVALRDQIMHFNATPVAPAPTQEALAGKPGAAGAAGPPGPGPTDEQIASAVAAYLSRHPPAAGRDGKDGAPGIGIPGVDGKDGSDGRSIVGPAGPPGESVIGPAGKDGKDGASIVGPKGDTGATGPEPASITLTIGGVTYVCPSPTYVCNPV